MVLINGTYVSLLCCGTITQAFFLYTFTSWPCFVFKSKTWVLRSQTWVFFVKPWVFFRIWPEFFLHQTWVFLGSEHLAILSSHMLPVWELAAIFSYLVFLWPDFRKSEKVKNLSFYEKYLSFFENLSFFRPEFFSKVYKKKPGLDYRLPQPYYWLGFSDDYVRGRWLKVALLDPIALWTTISINKTF